MTDHSLIDEIAINLYRRPEQGHFPEIHFKVLEYPYTFPDQTTAILLEEPDGKEVLEFSDNEWLNISDFEQNESVRMAPFYFDGNYYLAKCEQQNETALQITPEEYAILSGFPEKSLTNAGYIEVSFHKKEVILLDSTIHFVWYAYKSEGQVKIGLKESEEFFSNVDFAEANMDGLHESKDFQTSEIEDIMAFLMSWSYERAHILKNDILKINLFGIIQDNMPANDFSWMKYNRQIIGTTYNGTDKSKEICLILSENGQIMEHSAKGSFAEVKYCGCVNNDMCLFFSYSSKKRIFVLSKDEFCKATGKELFEIDAWIAANEPETRPISISFPDGRNFEEAKIIDSDPLWIWFITDDGDVFTFSWDEFAVSCKRSEQYRDEIITIKGAIYL